MGYKKGGSYMVVGDKNHVGCVGVLMWSGVDKFPPYGSRVGLLFPGENSLKFFPAGKVKYVPSAEEVAAAKAAEAEAAVKKAAEAALVAKINPKAASYGKTHASGWRDDCEVAVPIVDASASDAELIEAVKVAYPCGSSWGALRWRAGVYEIKVDRDAGVVRFIDSTGLAD